MPQRVALGLLGGPISSIALRRSAISVSRAVNTFSSSDTASARARVRRGLGLGLGLRLLGDGDRALLLGQLQGLAPLDLGGLDLALLGDAVALAARGRSRCARARPPRARRSGPARPAAACSARSRASSARCAGAGASRARAPARAGRSRSRSMSRDCFSASRFLLRIWIIVSCSMSLRIFLRRSICSVSRVRPSASKALEGLKNSMVVWSSSVSETDLQLEPVLQQVLGHRLAHPPDIFAALLVQLLHGHLGGDRAQRVDELALEQLLERLGLHGALAQRLGGAGDGSVVAWTRT